MNRGVFVLGLATLSLGSASAYLLRELHSEREQAQALQSKIEALERARSIEDPIDAPPPPAPIQAAPEPIAERPRAPASAPIAAVANTEQAALANHQLMMDRSRQLLQDPEYRQALLAQQKLSMSRMYPDLRTALRLQPEEADRLLELLAEQQLNQMSNTPLFGARGNPPDPLEVQQYQQRMQQQQREREAQIASLLGNSKLQEWQDYQKTLGARVQLRELRTDLAESGIPLREGQIEPLVSAMTAELERRTQDAMKDRAKLNALGAVTPAGRVTMIEQDLERTAEHNQRLHDAAAPYLSSDQLRQFDNYLAQQLEMQRASVRLMRAQAAAAAQGEIPMDSAGIRSSSAFTSSVQAIEVPH